MGGGAAASWAREPTAPATSRTKGERIPITAPMIPYSLVLLAIWTLFLLAYWRLGTQVNQEPAPPRQIP